MSIEWPSDSHFFSTRITRPQSSEVCVFDASTKTFLAVSDPPFVSQDQSQCSHISTSILTSQTWNGPMNNLLLSNQNVMSVMRKTSNRGRCYCCTETSTKAIQISVSWIALIIVIVELSFLNMFSLVLLGLKCLCMSLIETAICQIWFDIFICVLKLYKGLMGLF